MKGSMAQVQSNVLALGQSEATRLSAALVHLAHAGISASFPDPVVASYQHFVQDPCTLLMVHIGHDL